MTATNLNIFYSRQRLFRYFSGTVLGLALAYLYLVNNTVFTLVSREKIAAELTERQNAVIALETEYLTISNGITLERATALGFHDAAKETIFVRAPETPVLSYVGG